MLSGLVLDVYMLSSVLFTFMIRDSTELCYMETDGCATMACSHVQIYLVDCAVAVCGTCPTFMFLFGAISYAHDQRG